MTYSVFLSSTFGDFNEERNRLIETIPYIDLHVNSATRKGRSKFQTLEAHLHHWIDNSDAVVLLIGLRYGSTGDDGVSWTEKEIHYALNSGKDVFCYIREHPEINMTNFQIDERLLYFINWVERIIPVVPRYDYGQCCILTAMVIRDLDRWARDRRADEGDTSYINSFA